jgi:hypothetical protein
MKKRRIFAVSGVLALFAAGSGFAQVDDAAVAEEAKPAPSVSVPNSVTVGSGTLSFGVYFNSGVRWDFNSNSFGGAKAASSGFYGYAADADVNNYRAQLDVRYTGAAGNFGTWGTHFRFRDHGGAWNKGAFNQAYGWWKPVEKLKVQVGKMNDGEFNTLGYTDTSADDQRDQNAGMVLRGYNLIDGLTIGAGIFPTAGSAPVSGSSLDNSTDGVELGKTLYTWGAKYENDAFKLRGSAMHRGAYFQKTYLTFELLSVENLTLIVESEIFNAAGSMIGGGATDYKGDESYTLAAWYDIQIGYSVAGIDANILAYYFGNVYRTDPNANINAYKHYDDHAFTDADINLDWLFIPNVEYTELLDGKVTPGLLFKVGFGDNTSAKNKDLALAVSPYARLNITEKSAFTLGYAYFYAQKDYYKFSNFAQESSIAQYRTNRIYFDMLLQF